MSPAALRTLLIVPLLFILAGSETTTTQSPETDGAAGIENRAHRLIVFDYDDSDCSTPDTLKGKCGPLAECPGLHRIRDLNLLRKYICGYNDRSPLLCCPRQFRPNANSSPSTRAPSTTREPEVREVLRARRPALIPEECGNTNASFTRVVNGVDAKKGDWPWQVLVLMRNREGEFESHCGGSLISHRHVLSASHCFVLSPKKVTDASLFRVRLGEHDLSRRSQDSVERSVVRLITHENFEYGLNTNDIALMFMNQDVTFNRYISPICLPYSKNIIPDNITEKYAYVTGWGRTRYLGKTAEVLQQASFPIWDSKRCSDAYKAVHIDHVDRERFICAGDESGVQDSCQGDSGGPLVRPEGYAPTRFYQVGIVSFGVRCATKGFPGVYTRVTNYLDWINKHI
ncbi:proclotting enzyme-like [Galendromus occidentalis]|uniref:CLIP domain-containing serine protease n=1 Tax=Galendromus occidentalis TaxID=34638 RepID=A0AAJ7L444_9ACAR|nr:proclotting enzyme-like [Galendromus occidentalis]